MVERGRAAIFKGPGQPMEIQEFPLSEPEPGGILVKVTMANLCGSDLHQWRGDIDLAASGVRLPAIIGHEMTGRVAKLGKGISTDSAGQKLSVGDRVVYRYFNPCGRCAACLRGEDAACPANPRFIHPAEDPPHFTGAYADYYYLRPDQTVFKVPDDLTDQAVAPANCALSQVIYGLEKVGLGFGETVVIQGAGGLGVNATAVAKEMGAHKVIVIDGITERLELATAFGADELIDMKEYDTPKDRIKRVRELTDNRGAEVVVEVAGLPGVIAEGLTMLGRGGRYLEMGNISPGKTVEIDPATLVYNSRAIFSVIMYGRYTLRKALDFLSRTKGKYPFDKVLSHSYALEEINKAFEEQDKGLVSRSAIIM
jgi:D-arabinose 1-dehydrogenase-like Zn-dependent alcohol dehydrogenase